MITFTLVLLASTFAFSQVGIGTNKPSEKSILDLTATNKGFLLPRLTSAQRKEIAPNAATDKGMQVYDLDTKSIWYWNGIEWAEATSKFTNNTSNTRVELSKLSDGLTSRTAGTEFVVKDNGNVGIGTHSPSAKLEINATTSPAFRLVDGTQGTNKILQSDADGNASWTTITPIALGVSNATPAEEHLVEGNIYLKRYITLPQGKWIVNVGQLVSRLNDSDLGSKDYAWCRILLSGS